MGVRMSKTGSKGSSRGSRADLAAALRERSAEIAATVLARIRALPGIDDVEGPACTAAIAAAVADAVRCCVDGVDRTELWAAPLPEAMLAAARGAARDGPSLDVVLRCCTTGDRVLSEFMVQSAECLRGEELGVVFREQARTLDRVMKGVAAEYWREVERMKSFTPDRIGNAVRRLLADEPIGQAEIDYRLGGWHLGLILTGAGASEAVGRLAGLGYSLLQVPGGSQTVWVWLGGGARTVRINRIEKHMAGGHPDSDVTIAIGEAGYGIDGWRLTHAQAKSALRVSQVWPGSVTRYGEVLLLAAALQDGVLARSLEEIYLSPLGSENNGGAALRDTLRAYFASGHNVKASAAKLRVDRGTVSRRIRLVEERLGRPLLRCQAELEVALRLDELNDVSLSRCQGGGQPGGVTGARD